jgi:hypothetical protein
VRLWYPGEIVGFNQGGRPSVATTKFCPHFGFVIGSACYQGSPRASSAAAPPST